MPTVHHRRSLILTVFEYLDHTGIVLVHVCVFRLPWRGNNLVKVEEVDYARRHPTAAWTAEQLREAFPFDQAPQYLLRDKDRIFGAEFSQQVADLGTEEVLGAPRSPWQRAYVERVSGT